MAAITRKTGGGCADKSCPAIWETDETGMVAVQGTRMTAGEKAGAGEIPGHEDVLLVPEAVLRAWASGQQ